MKKTVSIYPAIPGALLKIIYRASGQFGRHRETSGHAFFHQILQSTPSTQTQQTIQQYLSNLHAVYAALDTAICTHEAGYSTLTPLPVKALQKDLRAANAAQLPASPKTQTFIQTIQIQQNNLEFLLGVTLLFMLGDAHGGQSFIKIPLDKHLNIQSSYLDYGLTQHALLQKFHREIHTFPQPQALAAVIPRAFTAGATYAVESLNELVQHHAQHTPQTLMQKLSAFLPF